MKFTVKYVFNHIHCELNLYTVFTKQSEIPPLVTLEMRIMGGSDIIMAPEYGNSFGTCSIEILSLLKERKKDTDQRKEREKWLKFMQEILTKWSSYTYPDGKPLTVTFEPR